MKKFALAFSALLLIAAALHLYQPSQQQLDTAKAELDTTKAELLSSKASKASKAKIGRSIELEETELKGSQVIDRLNVTDARLQNIVKHIKIAQNAYSSSLTAQAQNISDCLEYIYSGYWSVLTSSQMMQYYIYYYEDGGALQYYLNGNYYLAFKSAK